MPVLPNSSLVFTNQTPARSHLLYVIFMCLCTLAFLNSTAQETARRDELRKKAETATDTQLVRILLETGVHHVMENSYDSATKYYQQALDLSERLHYTKGLVMANADLGLVTYRTSRYDTALAYYHKALQYAEKDQDLNRIAIIQSNIGEINIITGNKVNGIKLLHTSEAALAELKDSITLAMLHLRMSQLYEFMGDTARRTAYLELALKEGSLLSKNNNMSELNRTKLKEVIRAALYTRSRQLKEQGHLNESLALNLKLLDEVQSAAGAREKIIFTNEAADTYLQMKNLPKALHMVNLSLQMLHSDSIPELFVSAYELRSSIYEKMGRPDSALADSRQLIAVKNTIYNDEMQNKINDLNVKQETAAQARQIAFLNREKKLYRLLIIIAGITALIAVLLVMVLLRTGRLQKKVLLQGSMLALREKEIENNRLQIQLFEFEQAALRAQMNPHFIFNSLNSIQHYVILRDIAGANRYISMLGSLIRLTLTHAAKPSIVLTEELEYIEKYFSLEKMRMQDKFDYNIIVDESINPDNCFIPPMLLQPFAENALKHGIRFLHSRKGLVTLIIKPVPGGTSYTITDNGVGRDLTARYKSRYGEPHESVGTSLSERRISMLQQADSITPSITITDLKDAAGEAAGTRVEIVLPA